MLTVSCPGRCRVLAAGSNPANGDESYSQEEAEEEAQQQAAARLQVRPAPLAMLCKGS